ncbi:MAG: hypothetical protein ACRECU_05650 [Methylocella sp.]
MSKALDYIKAALQIAFSLVVLAIILLNFQDLYLATRKFLERAASVSAIKALGVEIDLSATGVDQALSLQNVAQDRKSRVLPMIHRLDSKEFVRLMYVGQLKDLCEFENPSTEMRNDAALDYGLRDKGFVKIENSPATLESVRATLTKLEAQGKNLDNGYPRTCYDMKLTEDGFNVKTALVDNFSTAFNDARNAPP